MSVSVFSALSIAKGYDGQGGESSSTRFPSSVMMGMTWVRSDCVGEGGLLGEFEGVARTAYLCFVRIFRDYFVLLEYSAADHRVRSVFHCGSLQGSFRGFIERLSP